MTTEAIILAGGKGSRLKSVVSDVPKPMALISNKPFLEYLLNYLMTQGIQKVVFSVGYKAQVVSDYFGEKYKGICLDYEVEKEPLGTGGAIALAMNKISGDSVYVLNGDTLSKTSLKEMSIQHVENGSDVTIATKFISNSTRYGTLNIEGGRVTRFLEKKESSGFINTGVYLFSKNWFNRVKPNQNRFSLERDILEKELEKSSVYAFLSEGYFIDIGIPEDYQRAQDEVSLIR